MNQAHPPEFIKKFFTWFCKESLQESIMGDLEEQFEYDTQNAGIRRAKWKFTRNVIRFCRPTIVKSIGTVQKINHTGMFKNYFKVGFRNLLRYKTFSLINVFGLAVSMSIGLVIIQILIDQLQYDQFHEKKDRIFRVLSQKEKSLTPSAKSPTPLATGIQQDYPIIEETVQLHLGLGGDAVNIEGEKNTELRGFFTNENFFKVFDFELMKGSKQSALTDPNSIVLNAEKARSLFGDENPIGKTIDFSDRGLDHLDFGMGMGMETGVNPRDFGTLKVTGVIDLASYKSHFKFDALVSSTTLPRLYQQEFLFDHLKNWKRYSGCYTYLLLKENSNAVELQSSIDEIAEKKYSEFENLSELSLPIQKLTQITPGLLTGHPISLRLPIQAYYFLGFMVLVILFSACLNYTNLSIARSLTRAKEIGLRKVAGATRSNITYQFLTEAVITSFLALLMAGLFLVLLKPALGGLWINQLLGFEFSTSIIVYLAFFVFAMVIGILAGIYPAFILSRVTPLNALKSLNANSKGIGMKQILSTTQFVFSLFFIVTSVLIARQFQHYSEFEYHIDTDNVMNVPIQGNDYDMLKNEFKSIPGVLNVSACELVPSLPSSRATAIRNRGEEEWIRTVVYNSVDTDFISNLGLTLVAGENFRKNFKASDEIIIDQTMMNKLGFANEVEVIGQVVEARKGQNLYKVIGVIQNFEFKTPVNDNNEPFVFWSNPEQFSYLNVKMSSNELSQTTQLLEDKWREIDSVHPFKYYIYNDQLYQANLWMSDLASIVGFIAILAIVISCLGLLGMAVYATERRVKEVGIRKVLGASVANLAYLLSSSFVKMIFISILIAAPMSYFVNNLWLENFPNRVDFGFETLLFGSGILLLLSLLTIGFQVLSISRKNPVESLRDE